MTRLRKYPNNSYLLIESLPQTTMSLESNLSRFSFGKWQLYSHTKDLIYLEAESLMIVVVGHVFNPFTKCTQRQNLREIERAWIAGEKDFYDLLDELSGRFVLFVYDNLALYTFPDTCSSLPVFYTVDEDTFCISSHDSLIRECTARGYSDESRKLREQRFFNIGIRHYPGHRTDTRNVNILTPNLFITRESGKTVIERFFPRVARKPCENLDEVAEYACTVLKNSVECLGSLESDINCALSGGVDSRLSLAAFLNRSLNVKFFTFVGDPNSRRDAESTKRLAEKFGFPLEIMNLEFQTVDDDFIEYYKSIQSNVRHSNAATTCKRVGFFGASSSFEIRSSISEVTRCFFKRKFRHSNIPFAVSNMVPLYKRVPFHSKWKKRLESDFSDWLEVSKFKQVVIYEYDWLDMFYWEFRVGTWQSLVLQDGDFYSKPSVLFNNRKLLVALLSVSGTYRIDDSVHKLIMTKLCESIIDIPLVKNFGWKAWLREIIEKVYLKLYILLN